jgi:hypothetical protein
MTSFALANIAPDMHRLVPAIYLSVRKEVAQGEDGRFPMRIGVECPLQPVLFGVVPMVILVSVRRVPGINNQDVIVALNNYAVQRNLLSRNVARGRPVEYPLSIRDSFCQSLPGEFT